MQNLTLFAMYAFQITGILGTTEEMFERSGASVSVAFEVLEARSSDFFE